MIQTLPAATARARLAGVNARLVKRLGNVLVYQTPSGAVVRVTQLEGGMVRVIAAQGCDC